MKLYFGGSEVKMWRDLLSEQKVPNVGLSYIGLLRRMKNNVENTSRFSIDGHYPADQDIFLDSGAFTLNKEDSGYTREEAVALADSYVDFASNNIDRVTLVSEFDAQVLGYKAMQDYRASFFDDLPPEKFMPIWHSSYGIGELDRLCSSYSVVGISATEIGDKSLIPVLNNHVRRYGVRLHGVAITGKRLMREVRWDSVSSMSWLSPTRFGDTILWNGRELKRYPKDYKDEARQENYNYLAQQGFDAGKIVADDGREILKLSLWSWGKFVESLERVTNVPKHEIDDLPDTDTGGVDNAGNITGSSGDNHLLPAIPETASFEMVLRSGTTQGKSFEQRKALHSALIDLQAHRVVEAKKAEDQGGGFTDVNVSAEIDRLNRLIKTGHELDRQSFSLKIEASAPAGEGFMSTMFGPSVGEKISETNARVMQDEDIHEAEIIDER